MSRRYVSWEEFDRLGREFRMKPEVLFVDRREVSRHVVNRRLPVPGIRSIQRDEEMFGYRIEFGVSPWRDWVVRCSSRLALVPWVVWATLLAGVELLCMLMAVRP